MLVIVYSRIDLLKEININKVKTSDKHLVSLRTPELEYTELVDPTIFKDSVVMYFHDVLDNNGLNGVPIKPANVRAYTHFTEDDAKLLVAYFEKIEPNGVVFIHCDAGLSRSVALGRFVEESYPDSIVTYETAKTDRHANISILNKLRYVLRSNSFTD